jgi:hypothetical protein
LVFLIHTRSLCLLNMFWICLSVMYILEVRELSTTTLSRDVSLWARTSSVQRLLGSLPVWDCHLCSIGRLPWWLIGEISLDIKSTGEIKYPGRPWKLTYDGLPRGNQDLARGGNCKWEAALTKVTTVGDDIIGISIEQKPTDKCVLQILSVLSKETYPGFMYFINVNILGSQYTHSTNDLVCYVGLRMTDWWVETCSLMYK